MFELFPAIYVIGTEIEGRLLFLRCAMTLDRRTATLSSCEKFDLLNAASLTLAALRANWYLLTRQIGSTPTVQNLPRDLLIGATTIDHNFRELDGNAAVRELGLCAGLEFQ